MKTLNSTISGGGIVNYVSKLIKKFNIDTSHFDPYKNKINNLSSKISYDQILVKNRNDGKRESTKLLKRSIISYGVKYLCSICDNNGIWLGKKLPLQIDHIDGDYTNNLIDNLRFLCPNCHTSQCDQWSKNRLDKPKCPTCGLPKSKKSKKCYRCKSNSKKEYKRYSKEELERLIWIKPSQKIADEMGISDSYLSKLCKKMQINKPSRGYWTSKNAKH